MDENLAATIVPKADPTDKVAVFALLTIFFLLSALTSALPSPDPLDQTEDLYNQSFINNGDGAWMLTSSALVLLMTPGVSFFYGGMVDHKNIISTMYQRFVAYDFHHLYSTIIRMNQ